MSSAIAKLDTESRASLDAILALQEEISQQVSGSPFLEQVPSPGLPHNSRDTLPDASGIQVAPRLSRRDQFERDQVQYNAEVAEVQQKDQADQQARLED